MAPDRARTVSPLPRWEHFPHEADVGVRGLGGDEADAFVQAALALTAITVDPGSVRPTETVEIVCEAPDNELLLVDWLNALVYESSSRGLVFGAFEVQLEKGRLRAQARGENRLTGETSAPPALLFFGVPL